MLLVSNKNKELVQNYRQLRIDAKFTARDLIALSIEKDTTL